MPTVFPPDYLFLSVFSNYVYLFILFFYLSCIFRFFNLKY
ncbi:hypothetical protein CLOBOL_01338 [Enterocloster bolteae ATCC BAA-613]|uniref:Uncharacterized protein n=1 Tax=Enterocloster bolteae (strain ATCC BAA-613 / DSM 15670 / CCUG 46953 / JCM 12243 / WAL 16351) TaxID=411902 RepID=A8RKJ4_ENTBW|nr:hypothetical protein CLOBOL_01338 [Enterocloster bolteae ATCC BAA-613]